MATTVARSEPSQVPVTGPARVLVVDDSAVIRGVLTRWLEADPRIRVAATASDGVHAVKLAAREEFDIVILDIEMPEMDGMTALPKLLAAQPGLQVIMASTLTARNADISLRALQAGAADYVPKPTSGRLVLDGQSFREELTGKVCALADIARRKRGQGPISTSAAAPVAPAQAAPVARVQASTGSIARSGAIKLVPFSTALPKVLVIGSSTGGPQALFSVLTGLKRPFPLPIVITQHMPPTFTHILAQHIQRNTGLPAQEGVDGMPVQPDHVYVAPGDRHMVVQQHNRTLTLKVYDGPQENFCRPAVDPLFRSAAELFGAATLGVVLTGMGQDGAHGAKAIADAGGSVIAQDEASSVVWGMPGATAHLGAAAAVKPLAEIGALVTALVEGKRP